MKKLLLICRKYTFGFLVITLSASSVLSSAYMAIKVSSYTQEAALKVKENEPSNKVRQKNTGNIVVDISGAVVKPGIIELKSGSRLSEALKKGGGLSNEAAIEYIEQSINLSQILVDQQKIYFPTQDEIDAQSFQADSLKSIGSISTDVENLVNINQASNSALEELPGIGEVTAQKIIDNRPYATVEDLVSKKVMSASVLEKIQEFITL